MGVRLRDGVEIDLREGGRLVADGTGDGTATALSHAHGDHLFDGPDRIVCSDLTAALATVRRERSVEPTDHPDVELLSAGHVAGSRALLVDGVDGGRVLYTGDVCTRDRLYLDGFDPVPADTLVIEATYGEPGYVFPPHERVAERIRAWLAETDDRPVVLFGYALGRAQKLQLLADGRDRVLVTKAIAALNAPIADALGVDFSAETVAPGDCRLHPGDALVLPAGLNGADWVDGLVESAGELAQTRRVRRVALELREVCPRTEELAFVSENDTANVGVLAEAGRGVDEFVGHLDVEGVAAGGAVEGEGGDAVLAVDVQVVVLGHGRVYVRAMEIATYR